MGLTPLCQCLKQKTSNFRFHRTWLWHLSQLSMGLKLLGLQCYVLCVLSSEHAGRHKKGGCKKQCKRQFCCGNTSYQHFVLNYMCSSGMAIHCMSEEYIHLCKISRRGEYKGDALFCIVFKIPMLRVYMHRFDYVTNNNNKNRHLKLCIMCNLCNRTIWSTT